MMMRRFDVTIIGGGLAGSLAALAIGRAGFAVALVAPPHRKDARSTALMIPALEFIARIGVDLSADDGHAPLRKMRIVDATTRLIRTPTVTFSAEEIGEPFFGLNVLNSELLASVDGKIAATDGIERFNMPASSVSQHGDGVTTHLENHSSIESTIALGADGRQSLVRQAAGIKSRSWSYPQTALVCNFRHRLDHQGISTEFHTDAGPFTQVPLGDHRSSLVWVRKPGDASTSLSLNGDAFAEAVESQMQSMLGEVEIEDRPQSFALSGMKVDSLASGRLALIGEAAHVLPPIGAQGLNLGVRDVESLVRLLKEKGLENPVGLLAAFERARRIDVGSRTFAVDLLNRSLLSSTLPVQAMRSVSLAALDGFPALRKLVMREGLAPGSSRPAIDTISRERDPAAGRRFS